MEPALGCLGKAEGGPPCLSRTGSVKATLGVVEVQGELLSILKQNNLMSKYFSLMVFVLLRLNSMNKCYTISIINIFRYSSFGRDH